ncbi:hypothetical protein [Massilia sp. TWR1-2-2]|uniref:hypothetical protein n=1 Tax=Massilia sp. TWR1-2-2 TaxID=2804584 RepID=UPI003CEA381E
MNFLWILLFGSVTRLTEVPVNLIAGPNEIALKKPISTVTSGASLEIDVSAMVPKADLTIELSRKWVERNFKTGCVQAQLQTRGTVTTRLEFNGQSSFAPEKVYLILSSRDAAPVGAELNSLVLTTCTPLNNVVIYWRNYHL